MPDVLLLGSGMVARPLVRYLLEHGFRLTIASPLVERASGLLEGHPLGRVVGWTLSEDREVLADLVSRHDLVVSLLPAPLHIQVAEVCIARGRHLVTTSYVSPEMKALDRAARDASVLLLNEVGVDPGLDHMSALRVVRRVEREGGQVVSFRSYCGGLPAPASNDNPWGYKFSWSPLGVLRAGTNGARYLKAGDLVVQGPQHIFLDTHTLQFEGVGSLEAYPNRDSVSYAATYGLQGAHTFFRGTLRYPGWCRTLRRVSELGLLDSRPRLDLEGKTWARLMEELTGGQHSDNVRERVAAHLWLEPGDPTPVKMDWLGLFSQEELPSGSGSLMEALATRMQQRMKYQPGEQDMIVMRHDFIADYGSRQERIISVMVDLGVAGGDSSMSRTVSLPAAIAASMVLQGKLKATGVRIPITPDIYEPVLDELAELGIALQETVQPI